MKEWLSRRGTAGLLAIAIELAVLAALLTLGRAQLEKKKAEDSLATFQVLPQAKVATKENVPPAIRPARVHHESGGAAPKAPTATPPEAPKQTPPNPVYIPLNSQEMASADIGRMASVSGDTAPDARASGRGSGPAYGPGAGPGGERLYGVDWVRLPSDAELQPYMPARMENGWAEVACKTAPDNRVENCRSIGETPGSGLARMLRMASWQFRIRPPRVGNKPLIGVWMGIRYDQTVGFKR